MHGQIADVPSYHLTLNRDHFVAKVNDAHVQFVVKLSKPSVKWTVDVNETKNQILLRARGVPRAKIPPPFFEG